MRFKPLLGYVRGFFVYSPSTWRPRRRPLPHPVFFFVRLPPPVIYSFLVVATDTPVLAFYSIPAALPYSHRGTASSIRCSGLLHHDCYRRRRHRLSHLSSDCPTTVPLVVTCAPPPPSSPTPPSPTPKRRPPRIFRQCLSEPGEKGRRGARVPTTGGGKVNGIWVD